jgi:CheY-like chemotaxis protein
MSAADEPLDPEQQWNDEPSRVGHAVVRRARVLIIDDEPLFARALQRMLASEHDACGLTDAREALRRMVAGETFDIVLCDLLMPNMTGMDLHDELERAVPEMARRMVFVTGGAFTPRARRFLEEVPNRVLDKPIDRSDLRALIRAACNDDKK